MRVPDDLTFDRERACVADLLELGDELVHADRTLAEWRRRFNGATDRLEEMGYDLRFRRMWVLYLSIAEAGFRSARNSDFQLLLAKPQSRSLIQLAGNAPAGISSGISPK